VLGYAVAATPLALYWESLSVVVHGGNQRQSPATGNPSTALAPQDHTTSPPQWLPNLQILILL